MDDPAKIQRFLVWLADHGARFPKLAWPVTDPVSGLRGAHATEDIAADEPAIEVPVQLMMAPPHAYADEVVGQALRSSGDILHGDLLLSVYIMHELRKGEASFYKPYLDILPVPQCLTEWDDNELRELQDDRLFLRAKSRRRSLFAAHERMVGTLHRRFPEVFPTEDFSYESFCFAWNTVQARAFGRRLPWSALVPFADCLNHSNVQTKYSYDELRFRWFPSGSNCYAKGQEVFNSYGRRPNDNLLLDYGFAMLDNQWDEVEVTLDLGEQEPELLQTKRLLLADLRMSVAQACRLDRFRCPLQALTFLRLSACSREDLETLQGPALFGMGADALVDTSSSPQGLAFRLPLSAAVELRAVETLQRALRRVVNIMCGTTDVDSAIEADERALAALSTEEDSTHKDRLCCAIIYRLTRKHVLQWQLRLTDFLREALAGDDRGPALTAFLEAASNAYKHEMRGQAPSQSTRLESDSDSDTDTAPAAADRYLALLEIYQQALVGL